MKSSNFDKAILRKQTGANIIDQNYAASKGEDLKRSKINGIKDTGFDKPTWSEISEKWKDMNHHRDTYKRKDKKKHFLGIQRFHISSNILNLIV